MTPHGPAAGPDDPAAARRLARLQRVAYWLDDAIEVPVIGRRIGLDAVLGLVPFAGDAIGGALSTWIVYNGYRLGASWPTLLRMLGNVVIEVLVGAIPFVGDLFDMGFKANQRNVQLLLEYGRDAGAVERRSGWLAFGVLAGLSLVILAIVLSVGAILWWLFARLGASGII
ncbi:MAG: DUF4112 domain-containing protein [Pseudomonadota bacterium]